MVEIVEFIWHFMASAFFVTRKGTQIPLLLTFHFSYYISDFYIQCCYYILKFFLVNKTHTPCPSIVSINTLYPYATWWQLTHCVTMAHGDRCPSFLSKAKLTECRILLLTWLKAFILHTTYLRPGRVLRKLYFRFYPHSTKELLLTFEGLCHICPWMHRLLPGDCSDGFRVVNHTHLIPICAHAIIITSCLVKK